MNQLSRDHAKQVAEGIAARTMTVPLLVAVGAMLVGGIALKYSGLDASLAGAIVNWAYTVLTGLLIFVVFNQVRAASKSTQHSLEHSDDQERLWATLQVCDRYDIDSEISTAVRYLRRYHWYSGPALLPPGVVNSPSLYRRPQVRGELFPAAVGAQLNADQRYTLAVGKILNYFDSIAIGLEQRFYDNHVCREHIGGIFISWMHMLRAVDPERFDNQMTSNFQRLPKLYRKWGGTAF